MLDDLIPVFSIALRVTRETLASVTLGALVAMMQGKNIVLKDEKGGMSMVTIANVFQSNGVIHVVDTVVMPN
jgi:uncharacterized surface protein with fasciclin (FAS1) repeats